LRILPDCEIIPSSFPPLRLSVLNDVARRTFGDLPDSPDPRRIVADELEMAGDPRSQVLRMGCDLRERIGGIAFADANETFWTESEGWHAVVRQLDELTVKPKASATFRARCNRLLRGDVPLDPEELEPTLRLQYDLQVRRLESLRLLEGPSKGERFIQAIDREKYTLPSFEDVRARMQTPELQKKLRQGFDTLLLVPFGVRLERLIDAWRMGLRRNVNRVPELRTLDWGEPVWVWNQYEREALAYGVQRFSSRHGGRTKEEILQKEERGWELLLVEGFTEIPRAGQGLTVGGRPQLECGRSPEGSLASLPTGEVGWTPEAYIIRFLDAVERGGTVLDRETYTDLMGAYFPSSRGVPLAGWGPTYGQANLGRSGPGIGRRLGGVRAAVRVV
jgi:hypothetical protein